jgi:hypothetical protein
MGLLRTAGAFRHHLSHHSAGELRDTELWLRQARRNDQPVASMRCSRGGEGYVVKCEVYPVDRITVEPLEPGPYLFATEREAEEFAEEATLVFEFLGCEIADSRT